MTDQFGKLHLARDLGTFFRDEIRVTAERQQAAFTPFALEYMARVLDRFTNISTWLASQQTESLEAGRSGLPTLGVMWLEGLAQEQSRQLLSMQQLGDVALFTSGFFSERIARSLVDMDYFMAIGGQAYERAGRIKECIVAERRLNIFFEMSAGFKKCVDLFAEVAERSCLSNDKDLLRLYEKWLTGGSARLSRMLAEKGIIAAPGGGKGEASS